MDPLTFQEKLKSQSLAKDALGTLARELNSKLIGVESTVTRTLDSELVLQQAVWFVFHQQLTSNHEYPSHQYGDLSKSPSHEMTKPFSYNTEEDYLSLLTHYQNNPTTFAKLLYIWDSTQSTTQLVFPTGLTRESLSFLMAYTILHDLFGASQSFGNLDIASVSSNQNRSALSKVTTFLLAYINILSTAYQTAEPKITMDPLTWMLRPNTIFPKLLTIFFQSTCNIAYYNAVLPVLSWSQSHEHIDLSADWLSLMMGFQQAIIHQPQNSDDDDDLDDSASRGIVIPPTALSSQSSAISESTLASATSTSPPPPPPPQAPLHTTLSPSFMNVFATFCFHSNLTLTGPGFLSQLSVSFLTKLFLGFHNSTIPPEALMVLNTLSRVNILKAEQTDIDQLVSTPTPVNKSQLDPIHELVQRCRALIPPQTNNNRTQYQSLFSSQQLRDAFMPIITVTELAQQLPAILLPSFQLSNPTPGLVPETTNPELFDIVQSLFSLNSSSATTTTPALYTTNLINIVHQTMVKPLLQTPEQFGIITATPLTAISRRNMLIMSNYINVIFQTIISAIEQPESFQTNLIQPLLAFSTQSSEQFLVNPNHAAGHNNNGIPHSPSLLSSQPSALTTSSSTLTQSTSSNNFTAPVSPTPLVNSNSNIAPQTAFIRSQHIPSGALVNFLSLFELVFPPLLDLCKTVSSPNIADGTTSLLASQSAPLDNSGFSSQSDLVLVATPLNALYTIHSMSQFAIANNHLNDETVAKLVKALPQPPALQQPAQHGNRYLILRIATPTITQLQQQFEVLQTHRAQQFWAPESINPIISAYFAKTTLDYNRNGDGDDYSSSIPALKQTILAIATCLSALPPLSLFPSKNTIIATLTSLSTTTFAQSQNIPQALIILESLSPLIYALPGHFLQHDYALLIHILEQYQITTANVDQLATATTLATLSLQLVATTSQHIPALISRLRTRHAAVIATLFKYQIRKHIATHYSTILSFHTYLSKEIQQNYNLFNGYQRVYHRYITSTLPAKFEFYFRSTINKNRPTSIFTPTLPLTLPPQPIQQLQLAQSPSTSNSLQQQRSQPKIDFDTTPAATKAFGYFSAFLKSIPSSSANGLTTLALNEMHKSSLTSFINLPLNGITAMLHPSCGGRHPADPSHDVYICSDCHIRFLHKQRVLKSFLSKYFCDRVVTIQQPQNPKRVIELFEIAGYGGGMLSTGISGLIPPFTLESTTSTSGQTPSPISSYSHVTDYIIAHTTLKMFSICPGADTRWSSDVSFLRCFPTFSSFYTYMSQPQNDAVDRAVVLPIVMQHILATLQAYYTEKLQSLPSPTPTSAVSTPVASPTATSPTAPTMEQDPLAALAHQQLNNTSSPTVSSAPASTTPIAPPSLSAASIQAANQQLQDKMAEMGDYIYLQLIAMLPSLDNTNGNNNKSETPIKRLNILPNVPYVGHSTVVEALIQLERGLTVSSVQSKLYAFEQLRSVLTTSLANPVLSTLPYTLRSSIDGEFYQQYNLLDNAPTAISDNMQQEPLWSKLPNVIPTIPSTDSHSLTLRNTPANFQPQTQFAHLYDFGYICHERSPHHHSLAVYQLNQTDASPSPQHVNHGRFFDKHTKLPHITPFYPSLDAYSNFFPSKANSPATTHPTITTLMEKLQPYTSTTPITAPNNVQSTQSLPFYPFIEQSNTQTYYSRTKSVNSADDFIFLLCYILIISQPRHLPSTLSYIKVIYFGLTQAVFGHSQESEYKSFMDICIALKALQSISDRIRINTKQLFEKLMPPELLHFSRTHITPKPYAGTTTNPLPTTRPLNKIETQKTLIIQSMIAEGYNAEDVSNAVEAIQPPQALFDDSYKTQLPLRIRNQRATY